MRRYERRWRHGSWPAACVLGLALAPPALALTDHAGSAIPNTDTTALLTDNALHNTLVPNRPGWHDPGTELPSGFPGAFNTPQLRDVRNSAPYMHSGVFTALREVVEFYNARSSVAPLLLSPTEIGDLVAYLESL